MKTRLFHTIVVYGAALVASAAACGSGQDASDGETPHAAGSSSDEAAGSIHEQRCRLPEGGCHEHCRILADGGCLDPCFVHTITCNPECLLPDGTCGWPPTK